MITPKRLLALTGKWLLISVVTLFCALYIADELNFLYEIHGSNPAGPFGSVDMQRVLAIQLKGGKVEYTIDQQQPDQIVKCVHSIFPHTGLLPCWYLLRQSRQAIPIMIFLRFPVGDFDPQGLEPHPFPPALVRPRQTP